VGIAWAYHRRLQVVREPNGNRSSGSMGICSIAFVIIGNAEGIKSEFSHGVIDSIWPQMKATLKPGTGSLLVTVF
jgi:hypothetical protein